MEGDRSIFEVNLLSWHSPGQTRVKHEKQNVVGNPTKIRIRYLYINLLVVCSVTLFNDAFSSTCVIQR